jgi:hypothetical protein
LAFSQYLNKVRDGQQRSKNLKEKKKRRLHRIQEVPTSLVAGGFEFAPSNKEGLSFKLTLRFNECKLAVPGASFRIALREVCFGLDLRNCIAPSEDWELDPPIELEIESEETIEYSDAISNEIASSANTTIGGAIATDAVMPTVSGGLSSERKDSRSESVQRSSKSNSKSIKRSVTAAGSDVDPKWYLKSRGADDYLKGAVWRGNHFLRVIPVGESSEVDLWVSIPSYGVVVGNASGGFEKLSNRNILAKWLIKRAICDEEILLCSKSLPGIAK